MRGMIKDERGLVHKNWNLLVYFEQDYDENQNHVRQTWNLFSDDEEKRWTLSSKIVLFKSGSRSTFLSSSSSNEGGSVLP